MIDSVTSNEIANMYYNQVWSHCLFIVEDEFETDDIVQKAFLLFEQKRETLDDRYIKAWLYKVVDNLAKEYFRSRKIESKRFVECDEYDGMVYDILDSVNRECSLTPEQIDEMEKIVLDSLSSKERKIFLMHRDDKKSYKQIAEEMGMSENAVKICTCRTRKKIEEKAKLLTSQWLILLIKIFF